MSQVLRAGMLVLLCWLAPARAEPPSESAVKAAYLVKLRNYVTWPADTSQARDGRFIIGVVGAADVADELSKYLARSGTTPQSAQLRRMRPGDSLDGIDTLFIGDDAWRQSARTVESAASHGVLVVSESEGALEAGSIVNFRVVDERVRFEISLIAAESARLKLSSQLLSLALSVVRDGHR